MNNTTQLLEQLRDVQEPLPPESVGFWVIAFNVIALLVITALLVYRTHRKRNQWRTRLIGDVRRMRALQPEQSIHHTAIALRQLLLSRGQQVETLSGESWLIALDSHFHTQWFTSEDGQLFGDTLYQQGMHQSGKLDSRHRDTVLTTLENMIRELPSQLTVAVNKSP